MTAREDDEEAPGASNDATHPQQSRLDAADALVRGQRLERIYDTAADAMLAWDREGRIVEANRAACELTGLSRTTLLSKVSIHQLLPDLPEPTGAVAVRIRLELNRLGAAAEEVRAGGPVPVRVTVTALSGDPLIAAHAVICDESPPVAVEQEVALHLNRIRLLERELRTLLDNAPLIIFRLDPDTGHLLFLNRHAERSLGMPIDEALRARDFIRQSHADPESREAFDEAFRTARQGGRSTPYEARLRATRPTFGTSDLEITVQSTIYPLLSDQGNVMAIEGIFVDVSAEHAARSRLVQADRLFTLGMVAASVAHEINNPAAFLQLGLEHLGRVFADAETAASPQANADAQQLLGDLLSSVERIALIAKDLRVFACPVAETRQNERRTLVDVSHAVESALTLTRGQIMEHARVTVDLEPVPPVLMSEGRLVQVLVNLLVNASQALAKQSQRACLVQVTARQEGRFVEVAVADTGPGVPAHLVDRIWLPFFTTKGGQGTGLGLSISQEIVKSSGGTLSVVPTVQSAQETYGARFVVRLPHADVAEVASPTSSAPRQVRVTPRRRVLLVDDETALVRAVAAELGRLHAVTCVHDGPEALALLDSERFDVVLCDLRMPGMSGEALYERVRERRNPHVDAFVFMTGVAFGPEVERLSAGSHSPILEKPFTVARALDAIEAVSERRSAGSG